MKNAMQTEHDKLRDLVYAAMETGNPSRARTFLTEYTEQHPKAGERLRLDVIEDYGVAL
jgi:hypothetical protein